MRLSDQRSYARDVLWRTLLLLIAIALGYWVIILLNINIDATRDRRYTLSPTSIALLEQMQLPIKLYYLVDASQLRQEGVVQVNQFLQLLANSSNNITYMTLNPEDQPLLVSQFSDGNTRIESGSLLIEVANKRRVLAPYQLVSYQIGNSGRPILLAHNTEQLVMEALLYLMDQQYFTLFFAENHGEVNISNFTSNQGLSLLHRLEQRNYKIEQGNLQAAPLDHVDSIIFLAPTSDLSAQELTLLNQWIDSGKHLYINLIFQQDPLPRFEALINRLGVNSTNAVVHETPSNLRIAADRDQLSFLAGLGTHPITNTLQNLNLQPILRAPQHFMLANEVSQRLEHNLVLQSSPQAQLLTPNTNNSLNIVPNTRAQSFPLAIAVTQKHLHASDSRSYIISGDLGYLSNHYANEALMMEALSWLHTQEQSLAIPAKNLYLGSLHNISQRQAILLGIIIVIVIPGLLILGAITIHWQRKRG